MAAIFIAVALMAAMPYFLLVVDYLSAETAAQKVALVVANYTSMYGMYLVTYVFYGIALSLLAFALYDRMREAAPATMRIATVIALLWSFALVASGLIFNYGMTTVVSLAQADPAQARTVWQAIEPIAQGLGGAGGEILGGLWVLLVSVVALRSHAFPRAFGRFGLVIGAAGLASVVPPLHDVAMVFGLLLIVWLMWVGVVLVRGNSAATAGEKEGDLNGRARLPYGEGVQPTPRALES